MSQTATKFEKNFLLNQIPPTYDELPTDVVSDGYLLVANGSYERIREVESGSTKTWKRFTTTVLDSVKIESSEDIPEGSFMDEWNSLDAQQRLRKIRLWHAGPVMAFDLYQDELLGLGIAGSRHPSQEAADSFTPPVWIEQGLGITGLQQMQDPVLATLNQPPCGQSITSALGSTIVIPELVLPPGLVLPR